MLDVERKHNVSIAVIDDSTDEACQLAGYINTYFTDTHICQQTTILNTITDFLHLWHRNTFDLVFINIFLKGGASRIRVAKRVRKDDGQYTLIFTTSSTDFALKGYEAHALGYMVKPLRYGKFSQTMGYLRSVPRKERSHYIEVKESRIIAKLPIDNILYTDYNSHYTRIHLEDKTMRTYMRFHDFSSLLLCYPQFICCYRNCIINIGKVPAPEKTGFVFTTGERLPITRNLRSQIHQQYADYQFSELNEGI